MSVNNLVIYKDVPKVEDERICPVCTDEAPPDETHHPHYGAICCYGCKAFFRRAHQKSRIPTYKCKRDGKCVMFPKCKQHCKRCRLDKCLSIGMDPKWVMTHEEKRIRFKNFFKKKDEQGSPPSATKKATRKRRKNSQESQLETSLSSEASHPTRAEEEREESSTGVNRESLSSSIEGSVTTLESRSLPFVTQQISQNSIIPKLEALKRIVSHHNQTMASTSSCSASSSKMEQPMYLVQPAAGSQFDSGQNSLLEVKRSKSSFCLCYGQHICGQNNETPLNSLMPTASRCSGFGPHLLYHQHSMPLSSYKTTSAGQLQAEQKHLNPGPLYWQANRMEEQNRNLIVDDHNLSTPQIPLSSTSNTPYPYGTSSNQQLFHPDLTETNISTHPESWSRHQTMSRPTLPENYQGYLPAYMSLRSQLSCILDAFTLISGKASLNSCVSSDLILSHQRQKPMDKGVLMLQLSVIASTLTEFAASQPLFTSLCREDQLILLKANIPLYLQYILARYFMAENGLEQLNWILEGQICIDSLELVTSLTRISLRQFNECVSLFPTSQLVEFYTLLAMNVGMFYPFSQHCNGLIANMLLYHIDDSIFYLLKEQNKISCIFNEAKELVKLGFNRQNEEIGFDSEKSIGPLINTLMKMNNIFGKCQVEAASQQLSQSIPKQLEINYTSVEENWMKQKLCDFEAEYISVEPPNDYFNELVNLLLVGRQVGDNFVASWMGMETERMRRVLKMNSEFSSLSDRDQEALWRKNHSSATALGVIRIDTSNSGKDQLKQIVGILNPNDTQWENKFKEDIELDALNSNSLRNREINVGKLDQASLTCYLELTKELSKLCHNATIYQLFVLLTLLDVEGLEELFSFSGILKLRQTYLKFFQRKLSSIGCSFVDYAHFKRTLKKVKIVANLMENFIH